MTDNTTPIEVPGAAVVDAAVDVQCAQCEAGITAGERAVQALGIPGLFCFACGAAALHLQPDADNMAPNGDADSVDIIEALRQEYQVRQVLGWATAPAILVVDPDEGPVWHVGVVEKDDTDALARGQLNGDRLEVTFYQSFESASTG